MKEKEALKIFEETKAIITGSHIVYTSGRHGSAYVNKDAVYPYTQKISELCKAIAEHFYLKQDVEVVAGPAVGGVILSQWVAHHYHPFAYQPQIMAVFAEEEKIRIAEAKEENLTIKVFDGERLVSETTLEKGQKLQVHTGRLVFARGYDKLIPGKKVLVVEDILTTGGSAKKVVEAVRACGGEVVGLGVLCNRDNVKAEDVGDVPELFALTNVQMESWPEKECPLCIEGVSINTEVGKGREYLDKKIK